MDETISMAFLAVLERLSPTERAVFLLREVFGYECAEIANQINPDKLRHLGRVGDLAGLMQQAGRTRAWGRR